MSQTPDVLRPTRRAFVRGVGVVGAGLLAGCGRLPGQGQAQQPATGGTPLHRIGVIGDSSTARWEAFREGLRALGWVEGENLAVEYRWSEGSEGNDARYRAAAAELVQRQIELIVAGSLTVSAAAKQATSTIPIVAVLGTDDALEAEIVDNIARPGGNITGTAGIGAQLEAKQLELLKEAVPEVSRVAI